MHKNWIKSITSILLCYGYFIEYVYFYFHSNVCMNMYADIVV